MDIINKWMSYNHRLIVFLSNVVSPFVKKFTDLLVVASFIDEYVLTPLISSIYPSYLLMPISTTFWSYVQPLDKVGSFQYPRRLLAASNEDWLSMVDNIRKLRRKWAWMSCIMGQEVSDARKYGMFFKLFV